jgi:predicted O-linked N-acetylglucosamine transferase (SPINDLY family)
VQERILSGLGVGASQAEFIIPSSHEEALQAVNSHAVMIDTFPYNSGLTAREALAMGTKIQVLAVGSLFCERHTAHVA